MKEESEKQGRKMRQVIDVLKRQKAESEAAFRDREC